MRNEAEAQTVELIFRQYLELGSVKLLESWLNEEGIVSKLRTARSGRTIGRVPFSRGALYHLLRNETYLGMIRHKGQLHPASHPPLIDRKLFVKVQLALDSKRRRYAKRRRPEVRGPLAGRIFDAGGEPMSPTTSRGRSGKTYRYYVSTSLQKGTAAGAGEDTENRIRRISASALEGQLRSTIKRLLPQHAETALDLPSRIEVHPGAIHLTLPRIACKGLQARLSDDDRTEDDFTDPQSIRLVTAVRIRNRRGSTDIRLPSARTITRDPVLIGALQRAHAMLELDHRKLPVCQKAPETQYGRRLLSLAFLAPDLQRSILEGTQPGDLTLDHLIAQPMPLDWDAQRGLFMGVSI